MRLTYVLFFFSIILISCGGKESTINSSETKTTIKKPVTKKQEPTPVCKLTMNDLIGNYVNKAGFSARVKVSEKDPTKLEFVFQLTKGCKRKYSGIASKEEYYSVDEVNYVSKDTVDKVAIEISMFFTEGKLSIAERTSEKKDKQDLKCIFEGHLTKLK
jgi:hypothetical protein